MSIGKRIVKLVMLAFCASLLFATSAMAQYGVEKFAFSARNENGTPDVQAGSHPYALNATVVLKEPGAATGNTKDVTVQLPPGLVGNPDATPRCTYQEFVRQITGNPEGQGECPSETAVGLATFYDQGKSLDEAVASSSAVYNLVPPAGVAAEFGYVGDGYTPILLQESVRTGSDYGITTTVSDIDESVNLYASKVTIWGVPANPVHNDWRGSCVETRGGGKYPVTDPGFGLNEGEDEIEGPLYSGEPEPEGLPTSTGECVTSVPPKPLLTMPASCGAPLTATVSVDSWQEPGDFGGENTKTASLPELSGCEDLPFSPTISVTPDAADGSTPTGLNIALRVPQEATENTTGVSEADVRDTTVTLPQGVQLSPSAADGLQGCSTEQIGFTGYTELDPSAEPGVQTAQFTPATPSCPNASKLATVKIKTPLLEEELEGAVYLAAPQNFAGVAENPFSSLFALYLVAEDPARGVLIKLPGKISLNSETGQITTSFENTPQLPFSELKLEFYAGERAPLAMPALCGTYTTQASFTPWSGGSPKQDTASFQVTSGPNGSACSDPLPFAPTLTSGTNNNNGGSFSDLVTTLSREDGQQSISSVTLHYPPGLSGMLSGVKLCPEAQANAGTCGPESEIGEATVSAGLGGDPFTVTGGKCFLTEGYEGAPFGLSIVTTPAAGPFVLQEGKPVVVRAKIEVNPLTAALTVTTSPPGSAHAIPTIIDGVPLQLKHVQVNINRPGFTFNPTSCEKMSVTGTIDSAEGASSTISEPFQVANCAALAFKPAFTASTSGKTNRKGGASLHVKIVYPKAAQGTQSNLAYAKVELPEALPSRLSTLNKACLAKQFEANPAGCPSESVVGHALVHTPVLPVPLEGPAYFVSYGSAKFPELVMVLQGYGVTIDLHGETLIKKGVTSSTFKSTPDVPFESFELTLPRGRYSALAANGNLCQRKLVMPTRFIGQNGATLEQKTPIEAQGCPDKISLVSKKLEGHTLKLRVAVPAAGKLKASGKDISAASKSSSGRETITLELPLNAKGIKSASAKGKTGKGKHAKAKPKSKIKLSFKPSKGKHLKKTVKARV